MALTPDEQAELDQLNQLSSEGEAPTVEPASFGKLRQSEESIQPLSSSLQRAFESALGGGVGQPFVQREALPMTGDPVVDAATRRELLPQYANMARIGIPLAAAPLTSGMSLLGGSATLGLTGLGSDLLGQVLEEAGGSRTNLVVRDMLGAATRNAVPIVSRGGPIIRPLLNVGSQVGGSIAADLVSGNEVSLPGAAVAGGLGLGGTVAGPALESGGRAVAGTTEALRQGKGIGRAIRAGVAQTFRPAELSPIQQKAIDIRRNIKRVTMGPGQTPVEIPMTISEAINSPELTVQMKVPGAELDENALKTLSDTALHFAARTDRSGRSANQVADEVFGVLGGKRDQYNAATQAAVESFAQRASRAVNDAEARSASDFNRLFPGGRSKATVGNDIEALYDLSRQEAKGIWDKAYEAAKSLPEYNVVTIPADSIRDEARLIGMDFAKDAKGNVSVIAAPRGTAGTLSAATDVSGGVAHPDLLTLDQARGIVSELSGNIRNAGVLPGVDIRAKAQLLNRLQDEIENAVSFHPNLQKALKDANTVFKDNIGRFRNSLSKGVLNDVGVQGGLIPETIVGKLTGSGAETWLNQFEHDMGGARVSGTSVGTDLSGDARNLVREAFLGDARAVGTTGGTINLKKAVDSIRQIPEPVRNKLFPNFSVMEDAAKTAESIPGAGKAIVTPDKFLEADAGELSRAFGASDAAAIRTLAETAARRAETIASEMADLGLDKLAQRNQFDVYKYLTGDRDIVRATKAMSHIEKANPQLAKDVRALYLDDLIQSASGEGKTDPKAILDALALPSGKSKKGAGTLGGASRETAEIILGKKAVEDVRKAASNLFELPKPTPISMTEQRGAASTAALGNIGMNPAAQTGALGLAARLLTLKPAIRYRLAAKILSDEELRRAAMKPTGRAVQNVVNRGLGLLAQDLAREHGWRSRQVAEVEASQSQ